MAPATTLRWFKDLIRTEARARVFGLWLLAIPALLIWAGYYEDTVLAQVLLIFGLFLLFVIIPWLVILPQTFMNLVPAILPTDLFTWRLLGLMGLPHS